MTVRYDEATGPSGGPRPGTVALVEHWTAVTGLGNLGIYNPRRVRGRRSWSVHAEGRAGDLAADAHDPEERAAADRYVRFLIWASEALQVQQIIWNRRDWRSGEGWTDYGGADPHTNHVHAEQNRTGADHVSRGQLDRLWARFLAEHDDQEDDDMKGYWLTRIEYRYRAADRNPHRDPGGLIHWAEQVALRDPPEVEAECVGLLAWDNAVKASGGS